MLRLDTFLLGAADVVCVLVEGNLSAGDCVRLKRCSKALKGVLPERPGLLYAPMHRTFPFITGLSSGRNQSYYMSILNGYYEEKNFTPDRAIRIKAYILHMINMHTATSIAVQECVRMCWTTCLSAQGRTLVIGCLNELLAVGWLKPSWFLDNHFEVLHRVMLIVNQAFCVQRRRLLPGKLVRRVEFSTPFFLPEYEYESDYHAVSL
jgi:hypothetical protein